jgi:hypothetical protein
MGGLGYRAIYPHYRRRHAHTEPEPEILKAADGEFKRLEM